MYGCRYPYGAVLYIGYYISCYAKPLALKKILR